MQFIYCKESINLYKSIGLLAFCKYADRQTERQTYVWTGMKADRKTRKILLAFILVQKQIGRSAEWLKLETLDQKLQTHKRNRSSVRPSDRPTDYTHY